MILFQTNGRSCSCVEGEYGENEGRKLHHSTCTNFKYPSTFSQAAYDKDKGVDGKRKESPAKKEVGGSVKKQKKLDFVKK